MIDRTELLKALPHGESMCLLDRVCNWDADSLKAQSTNVLTGNPLLVNGIFYPELCIEYAAQAAAVHLRLAQIHVFKESVAFVASVKKFEILSHLPLSEVGPLEVHVRLNIATTSACSYEFNACWNGELWTKGNLAIMAP